MACFSMLALVSLIFLLATQTLIYNVSADEDDCPNGLEWRQTFANHNSAQSLKNGF